MARDANEKRWLWKRRITFLVMQGQRYNNRCYNEEVYIGYRVIRGCTDGSWGDLASEYPKRACFRLLPEGAG